MFSSLYFFSAIWDGFANLLSISLILFYPFLYSLKKDFRDSGIDSEDTCCWLSNFISSVSFHVASLTQLLSLWFSGTLCKGIYFIVPFDNSKQHSGVSYVTELDYFQGTTLWITLTLPAHPILHRTNIYFFSIFTMEWSWYFFQVTFLPKGCSHSAPLGILKWWSKTSQICSSCWRDLFLASRLSGCCLGHWNSSAWHFLLHLARTLSPRKTPFSLPLSETSVSASGCPNYPQLRSNLPSSTSTVLKNQSFSGSPRSMYYQFWPPLVPKTDLGWAVSLINFPDKRAPISVKPTVL